MPYPGERASKASHFDIVKNPDVSNFLDQCEYLKEPSDDEGSLLASLYSDVDPTGDIESLPSMLLAIDGSLHEAQRDKRFPSTRVGYIKVGLMLVQMSEYSNLRKPGSFYVDPFRVAKLMNSADSLTFALPCSNLKLRGQSSVRDSFRLRVEQELSSDRTCPGGDPRFSLRSVLFALASDRSGHLGTGDPERLKVHRCPSCTDMDSPIEINYQQDHVSCPNCGSNIYASDCMRLWETISEYGANFEALGRFMNYVEHLIIAQHIMYLKERSPEALSQIAFFLDGPLALFGNSAWLHDPLMRLFFNANNELERKGLRKCLIIGLQKTGQVVEHVATIERFLDNGKILCLSDEYRGTYINERPQGWEKTFGHETYYGQDFIFKTESGRYFVFGIPYPFSSKEPIQSFAIDKSDINNYPDLPRILDVIRHFEYDLYKNALIPIALAHRHSAISLVPGGRVLDLLTAQRIGHTDNDT